MFAIGYQQQSDK